MSKMINAIEAKVADAVLKHLIDRLEEIHSVELPNGDYVSAGGWNSDEFYGGLEYVEDKLKDLRDDL